MVGDRMTGRRTSGRFTEVNPRKWEDDERGEQGVSRPRGKDRGGERRRIKRQKEVSQTGA